APPGQPPGRCIDALDSPDVAVPGAYRGTAAVGVEIEARRPHLTVPRVVGRVCQHIDGKRLAITSDGRLRLEHVRPVTRPAVGERLQRSWGSRRLRVGSKLVTITVV